MNPIIGVNNPYGLIQYAGKNHKYKKRTLKKRKLLKKSSRKTCRNIRK
jgi:hypothetical protein